MALRALPLELARLVKSFLTLGDIIELVGCVAGHGLCQFLPAPEELDRHVPDSAACLRHDRRRRGARVPARLGCAPCGDPTSCVYHNASLRSLLASGDADYATVARAKMDPAEAIAHLNDHDDAAPRQRVVIEILEMQQRMRQLNRFSLARTLVAALRLSLGDVVEWIRHVLPTGGVPAKFQTDVLLASCVYEDVDVGSRIIADVIQQTMPPSLGVLESVLALAARHGRVAIVRFVVATLASTDRLHASGLQDALAAAAEGGHGDVLDLVIRVARTRHVELDATDALVCACRGKQRAVAEYLLGLDAVLVSCSDPWNPTSPLAAAVESGDPSLVDIILADSRVNQWNPLALQRAVGDANVAIVKQLLSHKDCRSKDVELALRSLVRGSAQSDIVRELVEYQTKGLCVDVWEVLEIVCAHGDPDLIEHVLASTTTGMGDSSSRKYWRPLVTAARHGHEEVVRRILMGDGVWRVLSMEHSLDSGAELGEALLAACHRDHIGVAQQLVASVSLEMIQLLRIVEAAAAAPASTVLHWLLTTQDEIVCHCDLDAALQYACAHGRVDAARLLLRHDRVRFADGLAIQFAATSGAVDLVEMLLADARVHQRYDLEAALVDASREGHGAVVALLLGDPRLVVTSGAAFHEAADRGHLEVLKLLLRAPVMWADPLVLDLELAFARAVRHGHYALVLVLLNDPRFALPRNGAITRVEDLPRRPGDSMWWRFLRRFVRHPRVDPTADGNQLLLDACLQGKRGVVDALLRSGRVRVDPTTVDAVNDLVRLSSVTTINGIRPRRARQYALLAQDLRRHLFSTERSGTKGT